MAVKINELKRKSVLVQEFETGFENLNEYLNKYFNMDHNSWVLIENPVSYDFYNLSSQSIGRESFEKAGNIIICSPTAELRTFKNTGEKSGSARFILEVLTENLNKTQECKEYNCREYASLIFGDSQLLQHADYFAPNEDGFLIRHFSRLCGVKGAK